MQIKILGALCLKYLLRCPVGDERFVLHQNTICAVLSNTTEGEWLSSKYISVAAVSKICSAYSRRADDSFGQLPMAN